MRSDGHIMTDNKQVTQNEQQRWDLPLMGMHCAACAARFEKALAKTPGVESATVNFGALRATVQYDPAQTNPEGLRDAVQKAGYDALLPEKDEVDGHHHHAGGQATSHAEEELREREYLAQRNKFVVALAFTIPVAV